MTTYLEFKLLTCFNYRKASIFIEHDSVQSGGMTIYVLIRTMLLSLVFN